MRMGKCDKASSEGGNKVGPAQRLTNSTSARLYSNARQHAVWHERYMLSVKCKV